MMLRPGPSDVLIVTDVQRDFCDGGALAVPGGSGVVGPINTLIDRFAHVIAVQDWHPVHHVSFASAHGLGAHRTVMLEDGTTLWPDHCVQGTPGADFHPEVRKERFELVLRKGFRREIDSYSAFCENDRRTATGLAGYLRERGFKRVVIAGLALDYCVRWSAEDARRLRFDATVIVDACRALQEGPGLVEALGAMCAKGIKLANCDDIERAFVT